jgi:AraC family transcriptional regulator of adaptative response/methylated-DNA-[protein]-cysteine methyltransferase
MFKRWAGVSPKAFVQCLTLNAAKRALLEGRSVLESSLEAGLAGPGRLHDLCVKWEAVTPGELKSGGNDLPLTYGVGETPFGRALVAWSARGLCHLAFVDAAGDPAGEREAQEGLSARWPHARKLREDDEAQRWLNRGWKSPETASSAALDAWVQGSSFQIQVWQALIRIPPGHLASYGDVARAIGRPGAARAVGSALAANPLAYLIPCHRVIRETGVVGEYRWGHGRKRVLIAWERALAQNGD